MLFLDTFFLRITTDFRQKQLLPLKLLFFVHASTLYVLYPYLTIHMRELGINVEEAAIMSAVTPIAAIIMPPLAGVVADRIGNFKFLLSVFNALGGAMSLLLLFVPVGRVTFNYPQELLLDLQCSSTTGMFSLNLAEDYPCLLKNNIMDLQNNNDSLIRLSANLEVCGLICDHSTNINGSRVSSTPYLRPGVLSEDSTNILRTRKYTVYVEDMKTNFYNNYSFTLRSEDFLTYKPTETEDDDARNNRQMKLDHHYHTTIRKLANQSYFFPTSGLYKFSCSSDDAERSDINSCYIHRTNNIVPSTYETDPKNSAIKLNLNVRPAFETMSDNSLLINIIKTDENVEAHEFRNSKCTNQDFYEKESISFPLRNYENMLQNESEITMEKCHVGCLVTVERRQLCKNLEKTVEYDISFTFWMYLVIRVFIGMIGGTAFAMFEGAVIAILREHKADYGLQRIYAAIGGMISSPLSGMLIDYASQNKGYTDFRPAFYLYAGLKTISGALMLSINLEFKSPATNVVSDVLMVLKNIEIVALFITCFILGTAWGYIESFLFWLLQDLGASRSLMGITITIGGIAGLPLLVMSGPIIDKIGHANVLFIGFIFYAIRLLGYSLIYNPWMCLIFEAMESVTSSLAFTAAVTYAAKLSTNTTDSSIQGLLGGLYFGVGKGAGSLIGGYLMQIVGTRPTYQIFSAVTLITGCIYYIFNYIYIERRHRKNKPPDPIKSDIKKSVIEKENEVKDNNCSNHYNNIKEGNCVHENIPINPSSIPKKTYTNSSIKDQSIDFEKKPKNELFQENNINQKNPTSSYINLGYEGDAKILKTNLKQL